MIAARGRHAGRPGFVIGNGTSLRGITDEQWAALRHEVTFGCNYLLKWDRLTDRGWMPTYYCASEEDH
ncbi:MAG: hypothetical protein Q8R28_01265, partial [Dehalococcoidia bacterium]|nr:hypothetical protein [Dehalococcoidia bacterium]